MPIHLEVGNFYSSPRPFLFELTWTTSVGFQDLVSQWWVGVTPTGCEAFILAKKLANLRNQLRRWAKFSFGSIKLRKLALL